MKPLIVLLLGFVISLFAIKIFCGHYDFAYSGRIAMSCMLLFTAVGHFIFVEGMAMMVPSAIPHKTKLVFLTGIVEIAAAIGLLIPSLLFITGYLLILFFIVMLPANIYAAIKRVDYQKADFNGNGLMYLWFRIPLQIFFMFWVYCSITNI